MKRLTCVLALLILAALSSGCAIARANAIRQLHVMPAGWNTPTGGERRCVAVANTGQCQVWVVLPETAKEAP